MWGQVRLSQDSVFVCELLNEAHDDFCVLLTNLDLLEGAVDHGDEHVEQYYHHGNVVNPVQHVTNVLDEFVPVIDHDRFDLR